MFQPHPFHWVPAGGQRHATRTRLESGEVGTALCGESITPDRSEIAWFWATCGSCNVAAHELAGVPMPSRWAES
ncbi:zinc finger protein [Saccharopolyspora sp. TS4A08]|uniref:Zinc finger protein n=2 Tax=Saccharopolyspora ipomoeae TaxID=3042027 RepID=A0ABT6PH41_9PSEU|nr:zinc finger protein [Saccharopolyspora sp. TS4A08]MDI2026978.1 zinc finger protein [Saccharopolyspora sp. TS4A08]